MTSNEIAAATSIDVRDILLFWPPELERLRLRSRRTNQSAWPEDRVLAALREASLYEFPLTSSGYRELVNVGQVDGPSVGLIVRRFGSWANGCESAGVPSMPARPSRAKWGVADMLQVMEQYLRDISSEGTAAGYVEWRKANAPDGPTRGALRRQFGSWNEAKRRALTQGSVVDE